MTESIIKFLEKLKDDILTQYASGLENISGHNGPYKDKETGVRAQAHLIVLLSNLDRANNNKEHEPLVSKLISELLNSHHRLDTIVFNQRTKPGKDEVNGVIGLAWIMEAMCCAFEVYENEFAKHFLETAEDGLRFNTKRSLWYRPVLRDNKYYNTIDETFNHQLWLAYALVYKSTVLKQPLSANVQSFFKNLNGLMKVQSSGMVKHALVNTSTPQLKLRQFLKTTKDSLIALVNGKTFKYKEYGYHLFNMFAFARMAELGQGALFANTPAFIKAKKFCADPKLFKELTTNRDGTDFYMRGNNSGLPYNRYGLPYNVAGFEFLYANKALDLGVHASIQKQYFDAQMSCYGITTNGEGETEKYITEDLPNLMLRSYELSYMLN